MTSETAGTTGIAPLLVIVSGAPGSGKTTLAGLLAQELGLPLVSRDDLKEVLYDTLGATDRAASQRLGPASFRLMSRVAERLIAAPGCAGLVMESNFRRGLSEPDVAALAQRACAVLIHCEGDPQVIVRRYRERAERGERHPGHHDLQVADLVAAGLTSGEYEPLVLRVPTLLVNTTTDAGPGASSTRVLSYAPTFADVLGFVRSAASAAP